MTKSGNNLLSKKITADYVNNHGGISAASILAGLRGAVCLCFWRHATPEQRHVCPGRYDQPHRGGQQQKQLRQFGEQQDFLGRKHHLKRHVYCGKRNFNNFLKNFSPLILSKKLISTGTVLIFVQTKCFAIH
jgi:hypothetical protein